MGGATSIESTSGHLPKKEGTVAMVLPWCLMRSRLPMEEGGEERRWG